MIAALRTATVLFLMLTILTGILYPLAVTLVAQVAFPRQAQGSLLHDGDRLVGSELLGQLFDDLGDFWGRPSATGPVAYNGLGGSGSNQATTNPALIDAVRERIARLHAADPDNAAAIPVDLVTASASGLDPHLSPAAALYQIPRVARARGIPEGVLRELIERHTEPPTWGLFGQPRVNVLAVNRILQTPERGASAP
jgi:K+-transporting ATPase ATPase C chain